MNIKNKIAMGAALAGTFALAACGSSAGGSTGGDSSSGEQDVKVGAMIQNRGTVEPWSSTWTAALPVVEEDDPNVSFTTSYQAADPTVAEPAIRQMLNGGVDTVIMPTYLLGDVAQAVAKDYPDKPMLVTGIAAPVKPNLWVGAPSFLQMGYVSCWALAKMSDDGRVGVVEALKDPVQEEIIQGCDLGAKAANPDAALTILNSNSYTDQQANRTQTQRLLDQGIDEIYYTSGEPESLGGFALCKQEQANCASYGDTAQWLGPDGLKVIDMNWAPLIEKLVEQVRSGKVNAEFYDANLQNKGLVAKLSGAHVTPELTSEFDAMVKDIIDGKVDFPESKAHPGYL